MKKKYSCINGVSSWSEGIKNNSPVGIVVSPKKTLLSEGIQFEPSSNKKGGVIVFSTDINAVELSPNKLRNWIKQKIFTLRNRLRTTKMLDLIVGRSSDRIEGWTIGHYFDGRYRAKNGNTFGEKSLSLEIIGIEFNALLKIAEEICKEFKQESVLLRDFSTGRILFVDPN